MVDKELGRCAKAERTLEVVYKMYQQRDAEFREKLAEINATADRLAVEKDVFSTFALLEGKAITHRVQQLKSQLRR
jgi:hypothetical protein